MRLLVLSLLAWLIPACSSSSSSCTLLGCQSGAHFQAAIRFTGNSDQVTIDVCKNNLCARGGAQRLSPTTGAPTCSVQGSIDAACNVTVQSGGNTLLTVDIPGPTATVSLDDLKDGDIYTIRVTRAATNETLVDVTKTVAYKTSQPNGPACAPTCKNADLS
jgi:hypothetical protein